MAPDIERALNIFNDASDYVVQAGLLAEVEWQRCIQFNDFSETDLLREAAWVILCSGFRELVKVRDLSVDGAASTCPGVRLVRFLLCDRFDIVVALLEVHFCNSLDGEVVALGSA